MANFDNLKRAFNHILLNVDESMFDMKFYRESGDGRNGLITKYVNHECGSVGCILGHCSVLDNFSRFHSFERFDDWGECFFEIDDTLEFCFLFGGAWGHRERTATKEQALLRLAFYIECQVLPDGFIGSGRSDYGFVMPYRELKPYIITE